MAEKKDTVPLVRKPPKPPCAAYAVVRIAHTAFWEKIRGVEGIVAEDPTPAYPKGFLYWVFLPPVGFGQWFWHYELEPTGRTLPESDYRTLIASLPHANFHHDVDQIRAMSVQERHLAFIGQSFGNWFDGQKIVTTFQAHTPVWREIRVDLTPTFVWEVALTSENYATDAFFVLTQEQHITAVVALLRYLYAQEIDVLEAHEGPAFSRPIAPDERIIRAWWD